MIKDRRLKTEDGGRRTNYETDRYKKKMDIHIVNGGDSNRGVGIVS